MLAKNPAKVGQVAKAPGHRDVGDRACPVLLQISHTGIKPQAQDVAGQGIFTTGKSIVQMALAAVEGLRHTLHR